MEVCDDDDKSALEEMLNDRPPSADMDEAVLEDVWIKVEHTTKESEQQPSPTQPVTSSQPSAKSSLIVTSEPAVTSSMRKRKQVDAKLIKNEPEVQIKEEKPEPPSDLAPPTTPPRPTVECQICHRTFKAAAHLRRHQSGGPCLAPPPAHTCPTCGQQFQLRNRLTSHLLKHSTDKPHSCPLCPMRFKHKSAVQRHVMLHTDRRPHACDVCGKRFTTGHIMQVHRRSHTQEKPYECPVCHKRFTIRHNMQRHTLNHNKIKHLTCTVCNKEFPKESRLKYHMRVHWADNKPFKCNLCPKSYSHRQNIQRHYGKKHPNVEFMYSETDAAIANKVWERTMGDDDGDETEYIVPEVTIEVKDEVMKPELVMIKEGSSSGETGSDSDDSSDEK